MKWLVASKVTKFHTEGENYAKPISNHCNIITIELIYDFTENLKVLNI